MSSLIRICAVCIFNYMNYQFIAVRVKIQIIKSIITTIKRCRDLKVTQISKYSRTSVARTLMARLPQLFQNCC